MLSIVLAIIFPVLSVVLFKLFLRYEIRSFQAIVTNYLFAFLICYLLSNGENFPIENVFKKYWLHLSAIIGVLFVVNFYLIALTAQKISVSLATMANKISLVIPVMASFMVFQEKSTMLKFIGIILAFVAIYMITFSNGRLIIDRKYIHLPILIFVNTGIIDTLINFTQKRFLEDGNEQEFFVAVTFLFSFTFGLIFLTPKMKSVRIRSILGGVILSIPNALGVYFLFNSLRSGFDSSVVFSLVNLGSLLLAVILGYTFFKERLRPINWAGLLVAFITILILSL